MTRSFPRINNVEPDYKLDSRGTWIVTIGPQLRIAISLVMLLISTVLVADFIGLMPRPEDQMRNSRTLLSESLAVQLSSSIAQGREDIVARTVKEMVRRNEDLLYAALVRDNGELVASFGERKGRLFQVLRLFIR